MNLYDSSIQGNPDELDLDPTSKILIHQLLGIIERMAQTIQELQREDQKLKDEIHRLKGEKGRLILNQMCQERKTMFAESRIQKSGRKMVRNLV